MAERSEARNTHSTQTQSHAVDQGDHGSNPGQTKGKTTRVTKKAQLPLSVEHYQCKINTTRVLSVKKRCCLKDVLGGM